MESESQSIHTVSVPRSDDFDVDPGSFSAANWLNHVLSSNNSPRLPDLLETLNESIRESHETLDSALKEALKTVPWVVRESERVRQRANSLRSSVSTVGKRVMNVESGVVSSVKTIADADTVVCRVQETVTLLEMSANADILLERLESLLASAGADGADLVAAADVVSQLRKALQPLIGIPELNDRFTQLEQADNKLEKLAAPQLLKALESRNRQAAINARIVFDHAGRKNAFRTQYVNLRGNQVRSLWTSSWALAYSSDPDPSNDTDSLATDKTSGLNTKGSNAFSQDSPVGNLAADSADVALREFYDQLVNLLSVEAEWLHEDFPDVSTVLLPALVCESLSSLTNPVPRSDVVIALNTSDAVKSANAVWDSFHISGLCAVTAAERVGKIFLLFVSTDGSEGFANGIADGGTDKTLRDKPVHSRDDVFTSIVDAITSLLTPHRMYWESLVRIAVQQARVRVEAIELICTSQFGKTELDSNLLNRTASHSLREMARDVEVCGKEACNILDSCLSTVNTRSCGTGIEAMKQACTTISSIVSDRLIQIVERQSASGGKDEWTNLNGALRLLIATSALKRNWDNRTESAFAVAVGTATPVLEIASIVRHSSEKRVQQFLEQVNSGRLDEAGTIWELVRDEQLSSRIVSMFESLDVSTDFERLVNVVHRVVYETMFSGVVHRFRSFNSSDLGSEGPDADTSVEGFSSSPLRYATEVADYLMTIPQQLEPFVPDEDETKYAMPNSLYTFCKAGNNGGQKKNDDRDGKDEKDEWDMSFAGMWIGVLAIGTMELYVEKICNLSKLSESGTRQLATDAEYLCNVIGSMGVAQTPEMALICRLLECKKNMASFTEAAKGFNSADHRKLIRRVAAVRGINVTM